MRRPFCVSCDAVICPHNPILERRLPGKFGSLFCFGREDVQTFTQFPVQKAAALAQSQD
jgi:hypothetical protein